MTPRCLLSAVIANAVVLAVVGVLLVLVGPAWLLAGFGLFYLATGYDQ